MQFRRIRSQNTQRNLPHAAGVVLHRAVLNRILVVLIVFPPMLLQAAQKAEVVADLLELFPKATVTNSSSTELRRPASAGGVKQDALFEHPSPRKPARVEFQIDLPKISSRDLLLFSVETAIADGVDLTKGADGVRFIVEVNGKQIFEQACRETRWTPHMIELTTFAGQSVRLALITHEIGNSSYDWAVWGTPRIIATAVKPSSARELTFPARLRIEHLGATAPIISVREKVAIRAEVKNVGYGSDGPSKIELRGFGSRPVPELAPGATWIAEWAVTAQSMELEARVGTNVVKKGLEVSTPMATNTIRNDEVRMDFVREKDGYAFARIFARESKAWKEVGLWQPLFKIDEWTVRPLVVGRHTKSTIEFVQPALETNGLECQVTLRVNLDEGRPLARLEYSWQSRTQRTFWGPNIYVNGPGKSWGLFPGLEYLYGPERSSNPRDFNPPLDDRRTPPPHQITIPMMAVTTGPRAVPPLGGSKFFTPDSLMDHKRFYDDASQHTVSLQWKPGDVLSRFASPNFDEHMDNHRLGLFTTNATNLAATLMVAKGPVLVAVREWLRDNGGLPKPNPWPRTFHEELDLCRVGFLKTVSDEKGEKFRHCIGWGASHSPGFAALLWLDSRIATNRESAARVEAVAPKMGSWISQANCHIMQWEFPFLYGRLAESMAELDAFIGGLIKSQRPDGGWVYAPANKEQAELGRAGDSVLGTCANRASSLLRYARITGDRSAFAAGEKALGFMEMFRVPRGGQTWECPMYEPDILAAAYAVRAYHDGYRITGDKRWLRNAVYWAETGVPFNYLWSLPNKPMMLGASIPVFGSTFYTHSWLGMPVQWCGLVYAYHLFHLAEELEKTPLALGLKFTAADWKRLVELLTVSGMYQQFADGDKIGAYPDSITDFEKRNPAFLNPEDILVNVLALKGYDPDIKTERLGSIVVSSGAKIEKLQNRTGQMRFDLTWFPKELSHTLITGGKPEFIQVNGLDLPRSDNPVQREPGWWWDETRKRAFITAMHTQPRLMVHVQYLRR